MPAFFLNGPKHLPVSRSCESPRMPALLKIDVVSGIFLRHILCYPNSTMRKLLPIIFFAWDSVSRPAKAAFAWTIGVG